MNKSGIYKITYLPIKSFFYIGSSKNLGKRFKYHYYITKKSSTFLGLFLAIFGRENFSITVIEVCNKDKLESRENYYFKIFHPLLNILTEAKKNASRENFGISPITKLKISKSLMGKKHSLETRIKMSKNRSGINHHYYNKSLSKVTLDAAAEVLGIKIYVYDAKTLTLVNNKPFRSFRETEKNMPIGRKTIQKKLDTGKPFKGFYYYTKSIK
uniref:Orf212 n=1 Tax=Rhizophydium sp. 136 TaxID=60187 RepID=Q950L5_9FUNG|nr:orf212 [Rhizophydium sp. 136]AAK84293.1 orf212 [Rhizophydium sp. 136]